MMAGLYHVIIDPMVGLKNSMEVGAAPIFQVKESLEATIASIFHPRQAKQTAAAPVLSANGANAELVRVLERAADDDNFIAQLTRQGSKALKGYNLSLEAKAALISGDLRWLEAHLGKLDERLGTWPRCRLQQEIW